MKKSFVFTSFALLSLILSGCNTTSPSKKKKSSKSSPLSSGLVISSSSETSDTSDSSYIPVTSISGTSVAPSTGTTIPTSTGTSTSVGPTSTSSSPTSTTTATSTSAPTPSTSSTSAPGPTDYWSQCDGLEGTALQAKIRQVNPWKSRSYDWSRYEDADEALDDSTSILSLYTRHNIKKSNHCGSYSWTTWNREHIWTKSAWSDSKEDNHNIFACEGQINQYRGDKIFAEGGNVVVVFNHTTGCKQTNTTFEPCDEAKGEVARSVMYGAVMYSRDLTGEIQSIALALKWHLEHPNTARDLRRNDVVYANQGNRNPFVDRPEYACRIWGGTNSETKALCGMN